MSCLKVLLLSCVCSVIAAPTKPTAVETYWWHNSCGRTRQLRHAPPHERAIMRVKAQYDEEVAPYLNESLQGVDMGNTSFSRKWLPAKPNIRKKRLLFKQLTVYAAAIHSIKMMELDDKFGDFDKKRRDTVLDRVIGKLRELICELEEDILYSAKKPPALPKHTPKDLKVDLMTKGVINDMIIQDYAILSEYGKFVKKLEESLKSKNRNRSSSKSEERNSGQNASRSSNSRQNNGKQKHKKKNSSQLNSSKKHNQPKNGKIHKKKKNASVS